MGIEHIPHAVISALDSHKALGIDAEMFSDGVIPLVEKGIITGEKLALKSAMTLCIKTSGY